MPLPATTATARRRAQQALLHIDLRLIAGKRRAQAQVPAGLPGLQLLAVIEIAGRLLLAEEQPVAPAGRAHLAP
jgi:hypothetical protein